MCLAPHIGSQQLPGQCGGQVAPYLPTTVPLDSVGGNITVKRKLFGFTIYSLPLASDGIVPSLSSGGYILGGPSATTPKGQHVQSSDADCTVDEDVTTALRLATQQGGVGGAIVGLSGAALIEAVDSVTLGEVNSARYSRPVAAQYGVAFLLAPCGHSHITSYQPAVDKVVTAVSADVTALTPEPAGPPVATDNGWGPFTLGMTAAQAAQAAGSAGVRQGSCTEFGIGDHKGGATIVDPDTTVGVIDTPPAPRPTTGSATGRRWCRCSRRTPTGHHRSFRRRPGSRWSSRRPAATSTTSTTGPASWVSTSTTTTPSAHR